MINVRPILRHFAILLTANLCIAGPAAALEFASDMQVGAGIGDDKHYTIHFQQTMQATNGNWVLDEDGICQMPDNLKVKGTITLTLKANKKSSKVTLNITGQKTVNKTVALQTDSGINFSLSQHCLITFPSLPTPQPSESETTKLVDDAIGAPTAQKLYRLAQLKAKK